MTQETVVVMGATGRMGQDIVIYLIKSGKYQVRALTRNAEGKSAKALSDLVSKECPEHVAKLKLHSCDTKDRASLKKAFEGAEYIWGISLNVFGEREVEYSDSMTIANAAKETKSLKYLVYLTLPNPKEQTNGKYDIYHCTEKARAFEDMQKMGIPVIGISPGYFSTNVFKEEHGGFFAPKKEGDKYVMSLPMSGDVKLWTTDPGPDTAAALLYVLQDPEKYVNKALLVYSDRISMSDTASMIGPEVTYQRLPEDVASKVIPEPIHVMFKFFDEFPNLVEPDPSNYFVNPPEDLRKQFTKLDQFFKKNRDKIL